jgi:hypothetical protein
MKVVDVVARSLPMLGHDHRDVQVLTPMVRGALGAASLNKMLQDRINPALLGKPFVTRGDVTLRVGDRVGIVTGGVSDSLRVTALVDLGVRELNRRTVIVPLRAAQSLVGLPGGATNIDLALVDVWAAPAVAAELAQRFPYQVESWQEANAQLVSALNAQSVSTAVIRGVVMIVVVLGISSVLVVSVVQKQREIGILRAMGATQGQVLRIFLLQGAIVGALGSALGVLLNEGIGDTIRVSLTPMPGGDRAEEVRVAQQILQSLGIRNFMPQVTACPGCGRTKSTYFQQLADEIQTYLRDTMPVWRQVYPGVEDLQVAVMGCVVNGPGESKHANIGISLPGTFEEPKAPVYVDGEHVVTLHGDHIGRDFKRMLDDYIMKRYGVHA